MQALIKSFLTLQHPQSIQFIRFSSLIESLGAYLTNSDKIIESLLKRGKIEEEDVVRLDPDTLKVKDTLLLFTKRGSVYAYEKGTLVLLGTKQELGTADKLGVWFMSIRGVIAFLYSTHKREVKRFRGEFLREYLTHLVEMKTNSVMEFSVAIGYVLHAKHEGNEPSFEGFKKFCEKLNIDSTLNSEKFTKIRGLIC